MRRPRHISTPCLTEDVSESLRAFPSVNRADVCDWRNLTYDSSIQILDVEEAILNGYRAISRSVKDLDRTMSSISEYGPEVMYGGNTEREHHFQRDYTRSSHVTSSIDDFDALDALSSTRDNLKDDRLASNNLRTSTVDGITYSKQPNIEENRSRQETATKEINKRLQQNYCSASVVGSLRTTGNETAHSWTGSDVCVGPKDRKERVVSRARRMTVPILQEEPKFVEPLQAIKYESKVGPIKRVRLRTMHREARQRKQRRYDCNRGTPNQMETDGNTSAILKPTLPTLINARFKSLTDRGSLSDFLLENETIPAINSATNIVDSKINQCANYAEHKLTQIPPLRASRWKSKVPSNSREIQCKRSLNFDEIHIDPHQSGAKRCVDEYDAYETVLNLCTRKPHMGLTIKATDRPVVLDKRTVNDIKKTISTASKPMRIKTNGTLGALQKVTKVNSLRIKSPRRTGTPSAGRRRNTLAHPSEVQYRAFFETVV